MYNGLVETFSESTAPQLLDQCLAALRDISQVQVSPSLQDPLTLESAKLDAVLELTIAGLAVRLLVEIKKTLYPRDVRHVLWQVRQLATRLPSAPTEAITLPFLIAERFSPGAQQALRAEQAGYFAAGGSLFLPVAGAYLDIQRPPLASVHRILRSLFSGRASQVVHALLSKPVDWFSGQSLAAAAHVLPTTVSQVVRELQRLEWVAAQGKGPNKRRRLEAPTQLLDQWVQYRATARPAKTERFFVPTGGLSELLGVLTKGCAQHGVEYGVTQEVAGQAYAPFLSQVSRAHVRLQPHPAVDQVLAELNARPVAEGANLVRIEIRSDSEMLFRQQHQDIWMASPIQVYLDLMDAPGRARELAAHLRRESIGF